MLKLSKATEEFVAQQVVQYITGEKKSARTDILTCAYLFSSKSHLHYIALVEHDCAGVIKHYIAFVMLTPLAVKHGYTLFGHSDCVVNSHADVTVKYNIQAQQITATQAQGLNEWVFDWVPSDGVVDARWKLL